VNTKIQAEGFFQLKAMCVLSPNLFSVICPVNRLPDYRGRTKVVAAFPVMGIMRHNIAPVLGSAAEGSGSIERGVTWCH